MMKKLLLLLLLSSVAYASNTAVTATITDTDGQLWLNGTWNASLSLPSGPFGNQTPTVGGVPIPTKAKGIIDANGVLHAVLTDTSSLDQPGGTWSIQVCPNSSVSQFAETGCVSVTTAIAGATKDLSSRFSGIKAPRFPAGPNAYGYSDVEVVTPPLPGAQYYNVGADSTTQGLRVWDGKVWNGVGAGGGGTGNVLPTPQYRLFIQPNAGTQAVAGPSTTGVNAVAPMLQGTLNADLYGGVASSLASSDCTSGCDVEVPQTSTSTEEVTTKSGAQVHDFRKGSKGDFFQNPPSRVFNLFGAAYSGANTIYSLWDQATPNTGDYPGQQQDVQHMVNTFNAPGFYFGTWGGPYLGSDWASSHGINITQTVSTPAISSLISGTQDKFSSGDGQATYLYNQTDGGCSSGADECSTGIGIHNDQHSTWFHGTVAAGATPGTQLLPVTYVAGTNSRPQVSVGGIMLNIHELAVSGANVTGPAVQVPGYAAWATPTDATVPVSGAWGLAQAAIPTPITNINAQTDTVTFSVDGGTNAGGFTTGVACLDGTAKNEQVAITAVGTLSGGQQSVTFTHRYPNPQAGTSLWQNAAGGGLCGTYYMASEPYFNGPFVGWRTDYPVFGARSTHEIVGRFLTASSGTLATARAIPNYWSSTTANVALVNLTVSGTTVTAGFASTNQTNTFDNQASAVISNASNSAFNGTVSNVKLSNNNQTISWTQTGVSGTSATALISYPPVYFNFYLFRGAAVTQPATSAGVPLEPNSVNWSVGNVLENPFDPAFGGYTIAAAETVNSPDSNSISNIGGYNYLASGMGISGQYKLFSWQNLNNNAIYQGAGGWLSVPNGFTINGATSTLFSTNQLPIDGKPIFSFGCVIVAQGGCGAARNDIKFVSIDGGAGKINYTSPTQEWFLNNIKTARIRANILSTGDGIYENGNVPGGSPVALTSASSSRANLQAALGTYGVFGNEGLLDTSAIIADKAHYAGTVHVGADAPTITGVRNVNTPGSSTFSYVAKSVTQNGESLPSATFTTTTSNATLNATNRNAIDILLGYGAQSTNVYRTAAPAGYALGLICQTPNNLISGTINTSACDDTGQATLGPLTSNADTSGKLMDKSLADGCLNVASGQIGSTGTPCGSGGGMVYPGVGIARSTGSGWDTPLAAPSGTIVGTTDTQTLTNKTLGAGTTFDDGTGTGAGVNGLEGTAISGAISRDAIWADSTAHRFKMNNNNGVNLAVAGMLTGTTGTITGTALSGSCDSGTATVTGAVVGTPVLVSATDGVDVGAAFVLRGSVTATSTVTVYICGTGTPASKAYNVTVIQ